MRGPYVHPRHIRSALLRRGRRAVLSRFVQGMREKESRRFFVVYLVGKMAGVGLLLAAIWVISGYLHTPAGAQETATGGGVGDQIASVVNTTNTMWTLIAGFLVFFMQ